MDDVKLILGAQSATLGPEIVVFCTIIEPNAAI